MAPENTLLKNAYYPSYGDFFWTKNLISFNGDPMCITYFGFNLYRCPAALQINVQKKASPRDIA